MHFWKLCGFSALCLLAGCATNGKKEQPAAADAAPAGEATATADSQPTPAEVIVSAEAEIQQLPPNSPEALKLQQRQAKENAKLAKKAAKERRAAERREAKLAKERAKKRQGEDKNLTKEQREELAIREAAMRYILSVERPGEVAFISFSPLDSVSQSWEDPSQGFLDRLSDLSLQLRPASQAIHTRSPVEDLERPNRMIQDPITKNAASVYWADLLKAPKEDTVRVDAGCFRGFLSSWGCILEMKKVRGVWQVQAQTAVWKT